MCPPQGLVTCRKSDCREALVSRTLSASISLHATSKSCWRAAILVWALLHAFLLMDDQIRNFVVFKSGLDGGHISVDQKEFSLIQKVKKCFWCHFWVLTPV